MAINENITKRNTLLAQKVIKGLESRNMSGYFASSKEEALKLAMVLIPTGSSVTMGGAMLYYGWPYFAWSAGYDTAGREAEAEQEQDQEKSTSFHRAGALLSV